MRWRPRPTSAPLGQSDRGAPPLAGPLLSRPISRILSRAVIHLSGLPEPWRATCKRFCSALHQVGFTWPPRHRDAGALLPHHFTLTGLGRCSGPRLRRCHFCGTFPRVSPGRRYRPPCPVMSGLSSKALTSATAQPAPTSIAAARAVSELTYCASDRPPAPGH